MRVVLQYIMDELSQHRFRDLAARDEDDAEHVTQYLQGHREGIEDAFLILEKYAAIVDAVKKT